MTQFFSIVRAAALKVQMGYNVDIQAVETDAISIDFALISAFHHIERLSTLHNHRTCDSTGTEYELIATKVGVPIEENLCI